MITVCFPEYGDPKQIRRREAA